MLGDRSQYDYLIVVSVNADGTEKDSVVSACTGNSGSLEKRLLAETNRLRSPENVAGRCPFFTYSAHLIK